MISLFDIKNFNIKCFERFVTLHGIDVIGCLGRTPLFYACQCGRDDVVMEILRNGANVNIQDHFGRTALHIACLQYNNEKIIRLLVPVSDLNLRDKDGKTAKDVCIKVNYLEIFQDITKSTP